jgi:hypothetical protein
MAAITYGNFAARRTLKYQIYLKIAFIPPQELVWLETGEVP